MTLALGVFIFGTFFGLGMGRLFCKQHHKGEARCKKDCCECAGVCRCQ